MQQLIRSNLLFIIAWALSFAPMAFAQDNEPATNNTANNTVEETKPSSSQEVEVNEDTYRQFMELRDANRQGDIIPETVYKPGSGLQKLEKLPEESQKHLRNELRGIIVQGDPWQPGDENAEYPYTPSDAASKDPNLQKQEREAWGELVDSYNQREAQIYANMAGNRAAISPEAGKGSMPGRDASSDGKDGEDKEGVKRQSTEQAGDPDRGDTAGAFSPDAVHDPNTQSATGVSQNALEFLQGLGGNGENTGGEQTGTPQGNSGQPGAPTPGENQAQAQTGQRGTTDSSLAAKTKNAASQTDPGTAGASQNAMEFLNQVSAQAGNASASSTGTSSADGSQGVSDQSASSTAQNQGQQAGQDSGQSTAQNSSQSSSQGEELAESEEHGEQGEGQAGSQDEGQAQAGQQTETVQKSVSIPVPKDNITFSTSEPEEESTVGTSQNALEYLTGESVQTGEVADGEANKTPPPAGTLNIQDLLNAQGVVGTTGTGDGNTVPAEEKPSAETKSDKDGGGR